MRNINQPSVAPHRRQFLEVVAAALSTALFKGTVVSANQQTRDSSSAPSTAAVIDDLVAANRILAKEGIVDGYGHVSARHPTTRERFLMSRSVAPESVEAADVMEYGLDAQPVDARGWMSYQERFIHSEIYRARRDVNALVHCHTPSLIPFADSDVALRGMYVLGAFIAEGVPVFEIRAVGGMTDLLVKDSKLGAALAATEPLSLEDCMWTIETPWFDVAVFMSLFATGSILFGHFEQHKPAWRRLLKPVIILAVLIPLARTAGRSWAYGVLALLFSGAGSFHFWWLSKHGINGWTGEPRDKYLALVGRLRNSGRP